jgi:site-specific DNA-methyltransferase (adenine-specific)
MKKEVCDFFINNFTKPNDIVLDIFTGMGTTELCCKEQGRRYIGSELSKKYFDMCIERIK